MCKNILASEDSRRPEFYEGIRRQAGILAGPCRGVILFFHRITDPSMRKVVFIFGSPKINNNIHEN